MTALSHEANPVVAVRVALPGGDLLSSPEITIKGRIAWALHWLIQRGDQGVTPIEQPGPRWSDYVFQLKKRDIEIETIREGHKGAFSGTHARYVLKTPVRLIETKRVNGAVEVAANRQSSAAGNPVAVLRSSLQAVGAMR